MRIYTHIALHGALDTLTGCGYVHISGAQRADRLTAFITAARALREFGTGVTFWGSLRNTSADSVTLKEAMIEVLMVVPHACGVERVNKNHDLVHTSNRASMKETTLVKALFCYSNLTMLYRKRQQVILLILVRDDGLFNEK